MMCATLSLLHVAYDVYADSSRMLGVTRPPLACVVKVIDDRQIVVVANEIKNTPKVIIRGHLPPDTTNCCTLSHIGRLCRGAGDRITRFRYRNSLF